MIEVNKSLEYEKIEKMLEEYFSFEDSLEDFKKEEMIKDDFYLDRETCKIVHDMIVTDSPKCAEVEEYANIVIEEAKKYFSEIEINAGLQESFPFFHTSERGSNPSIFQDVSEYCIQAQLLILEENHT